MVAAIPTAEIASSSDLPIRDYSTHCYFKYLTTTYNYRQY